MGEHASHWKKERVFFLLDWMMNYYLFWSYNLWTLKYTIIGCDWSSQVWNINGRRWWCWPCLPPSLFLFRVGGLHPFQKSTTIISSSFITLSSLLVTFSSSSVKTRYLQMVVDFWKGCRPRITTMLHIVSITFPWTLFNLFCSSRNSILLYTACMLLCCVIGWWRDERNVGWTVWILAVGTGDLPVYIWGWRRW